MEVPWSNWCRLCSKDNGCEIDIININNKSENDNENNWDLCGTIGKYFPVSIDDIGRTPTGICRSCHRFIKNLQLFSDRVIKVEMMFNKLIEDKMLVTEIIDGDYIRQQYGILKEKYFDESKQLIKNNDQTTDTYDLEEYMENKCLKRDPTDNLYEENCEVDVLPQESVCVILNTKSEYEEEKTTLRNCKLRSRKINYRNVEECEANDDTKEYNSDTIDEDFEEQEGNKKKKPQNRKKKSNDSTSGKESPKPKRRRNKEKPIIKCEICDREFARRNNLRYHKENIHSMPQGLKFKCSVCGKKFFTEKSLKVHEYIHLPQEEKLVYPCSHCDKKFTKTGNINAHIRAVHTNERSLICEKCGKAFVTKGALKEHGYTHTDETPFQCSRCPKKFKYTSLLKIHEDTHSDTIYVCPHCGLKLNTRRILNRHMVVHSDKKEYKCQYCGIEFRRSDSLKRHLVVHTGQRPFVCQFCDKTFASGSESRLHKRKVHPVELAALELSAEDCVPQVNLPKLDQLKAVAAQTLPHRPQEPFRKSYQTHQQTLE